MATTISTGFANSPKKLANIADHGVIYGGRGLVFDGVVDYATASSGFPIDIGSVNVPLTFSVWLKPDASASGYRYMMANHLSTQFFWNSGVISTQTNAILSSTAGAAPVGVWTHAVFVNEGTGADTDGNAYLYINGELNNSHALANVQTDNFSSDSDLHIGRLSGGWTTNHFHGTLSDLKIFNVALSSTEVQELYLKPEQSAPSAVRDNLVAWYPMCEGNPDSPQSVVYDHSEKKLGSELLTGTDSDFSGAGNWQLLGVVLLIIHQLEVK